MNIDITSRHAAVSDALKEHAEKKIENVLRPVQQDITSVHVILDVEKNRKIAEIVVHGRHLAATVHAESDDLQASIDRAADKLRGQMERHHDKRIAKRRRSTAIAEAEAAAIAQGAYDRDDEEEEAAAAEPAEEAPAEEPITRTRLGDLADMSVAEATVAVDGTADGLCVFRDTETEKLSVLYRRQDGSLVLVEIGAA